MRSPGPEIFTPEYYERLEKLERDHWWCRSVRRVGLDLLAPLLSGGALVLDAGCGTGGFLLAFGERRALGADVSLDALARARRGGLRSLAAASVTDLPFGDGRFEAVVSNDVLQHLPAVEDERCLAEAWRVLRHGGHLCLRTNIGESSPGSGHRRYAPKELAQLAGNGGFAIRRHVVLHPVARLWADLREARRAAPAEAHHGLSLTLPPAPVNAALDLYSRFEDFLIRRLPGTLARGDAQVLLARKTDRYTAAVADE